MHQFSDYIRKQTKDHSKTLLTFLTPLQLKLHRKLHDITFQPLALYSPGFNVKAKNWQAALFQGPSLTTYIAGITSTGHPAAIHLNETNISSLDKNILPKITPGKHRHNHSLPCHTHFNHITYQHK
jgi:hypothetical protein